MDTIPNSKTPMWVFLAILSLPFLYLAFVWSSLPTTIPLHFDLDGKPNRYGSRYELVLAFGIISLICMGIWWLMNNMEKIDPRRSKQNAPIMKKITLLIIFFMAAIMIFVVYTTNAGTIQSPRFILVAIALLFSFLGNLMNAIRPNYFVGLRTPWTLENETVWRKTHHFASRLWFFGGLIEALLALVLPAMAGFITIVAGQVALILIPVVYSYRIYKAEKALK